MRSCSTSFQLPLHICQFTSLQLIGAFDDNFLSLGSGAFERNSFFCQALSFGILCLTVTWIQDIGELRVESESCIGTSKLDPFAGGHHVASASSDHSVRVWDILSGGWFHDCLFDCIRLGLYNLKTRGDSWIQGQLMKKEPRGCSTFGRFCSVCVGWPSTDSSELSQAFQCIALVALSKFRLAKISHHQ